MTQYPSAVSRVFSIHELTETILLRAYNLSIPAPTLSPNPKAANSTEYKQAFLLPAKAHSAGMRWLLCTANRVNRFWNTVLSTSPTLQQHLFFQWRGTQRDRDVKFNPLLASTFTWGYFTYNNKICPDDLYTETSKFREAIVYPAASWRKMFPVVPPVRYMYVDQRLHTEQGIGTGHIDLDGVLQNDGLRMGMLFDVAEEWKKPFYGSSFNLAWMGDVDVHTFHRPDK
ncbi:hypothetical protein K458DRAFT_195011 [Lentithecium fluviatile CBS 122367]|uniref:Uncharacterized protein n=1 Tax=Lentithecium fluviatile CBS 122367 TaxID=1168545 RepID=A0A6G1IDJ6_9PLEO|nr:hypothetical protein K458DRAFT_195011 [Lentithecium fluviatile CBS 122367]